MLLMSWNVVMTVLNARKPVATVPVAAAAA
jgi:hypothetical protein